MIKCKNNVDFSNSSCGFVIEFADIISLKNLDSSSSHYLSNGYPSSSMSNYLNGYVYNLLPSDLKSGIISTRVTSGYGMTTDEYYVAGEKIFLLSAVEVWGALPGNQSEHYTRQLDYYKNNSVTARSYTKTLKKYNGTNTGWWTRYSNDDGTNFLGYFVDTNGYYNISGVFVNSDRGVSPAFRIGVEK